MDDIKKEWLNVVRRLQSVSKSNGYGVVHMTILVDADGNPVAWCEPRMSKIEPKGASLQELFQRLGQDKFEEVLEVFLALSS